ncbi:MAG: LysM peptidoglycan-binding domain-containing protein [Candidatus Fibromonas sp.]|nr:LysM peptidoglycan-binding domain-containing protein [Candidatus Fibromonas sp.]
MRFFKTFRFLSLLAFLLFACSANPRKGEAIAATTPAEKVEEISQPAPEPLKHVGAEGKTSWEEYKAGMLVFEKDPVAAMRYLDLALNEIYSEQQLDSLNSPEDSLYFSTMPTRIILALENLYPRLVNMADLEQTNSVLNDYEDLDSFEETPLDSAEKENIENYLDSIDLSRFSFPIDINDRVMQEIHFLTVNVRSFTETSLSRKTALDSMIYSKLRERNMPEDLIYLALIESGFKTSAYSRAKAAGVWQFIPGTGKRYGLSVDFWLDMRRNPAASTDAALGYLNDLYNEFGDWYLAMAAYNCGEGRIRRLVKEGLAANPSKKVSYWDLKLPRETMHYVPRVIAATIIGHNPEHYSFEVQKQNTLPFDTATIKDCIPLDKVGGAVGVSPNTIRELNPELIRWCTPPNLKSYTIRVPQGTREKFLAAYAKMDKTQLVRWQQYKVQKGDNLGNISRQFGLKPSDVQAANNLKNSKLRAGQILIIPMPAGAAMPERQRKSNTAEKIVSKTDNNAKTYVVRRGDNLSSIARRFGVSSQSLMVWNDLQSNKVAIGQKLYLQDPSKKDANKEASKNENLAKSISAKGASYEVKPGDSLWDIARAHEVTVKQLLDWNPGLEKKIYPGMKIKVGE